MVARVAALLVIAVAFVAGVWTRFHDAQPESTVAPAKLLAILSRAGLDPVGSFAEPATGLAGVEARASECPRPVAVLPVVAWNTEIAPEALAYKQGEFTAKYIYDGAPRSARWMTYWLAAVSVERRAVAMLTLGDIARYNYYVKIWIPNECLGLAPSIESRLSDGG